jgi:hypothetical protein
MAAERDYEESTSSAPLTDPESVDAAAPREGDERVPTREARVPTPEEPVLPSVSRDERDVGWGDESSARDADWYRRERPPHHE